MVNVEDINRFKKAKNTEKKKEYSAEFEIREFITEQGVVRKQPLIVFKSKYGKYLAQYYLLNPVRVNNFPELQHEFSEYYAAKYDGSLDDAPSDVRDILISYGFYKKDIAIRQSRDFILALLYDFDEKIKIKVINYLEKNNAFVVTGKSRAEDKINRMEDTLVKMEKRLKERDSLIEELLKEKANRDANETIADKR